MKKKFIIIAVICLILFAFLKLVSDSHLNQNGYHSNNSLSEKTVSIIVATDLHYLSPSLHDNGSFFTEMIDNADGKYMYYIEDITEAFVDTVIEEKPEFLILSGDLTFNGERESHLGLEKKLNRIKKAGITILVIPGNHDIDRSSAAKFTGDGYELVDSISKKQFSEIYGQYGLQKSLHKDDNSLSYIYSARKDLWFLCVDSNSNGDNKLSSETLKWIEDRLKEAEKNKIKVIGISHQNLISHNPDFTSGFLIDQSPKLSALYRNSPLFLNLSGHIHIQHISKGQTPEIITSSLAVSPHQYGKITVSAKTLDYKVEQLDVEGWAKDKQMSDETLLHFSQHSRAFMEDVAKRKSNEWLSTSQLPTEKLILARNTFASLNADYFAGKSINIADYSEGISILKNEDDGFITSYLETILTDTQKNHQEVSLSID